ncbi:MAG: LruC domain-containing protein [Bacteroidota bacterium]
MMKPLAIVATLFFMTSCLSDIEELPSETTNEVIEEVEEEFAFPPSFEFSTSRALEVQILGNGLGVVEVYLNQTEPILLGKFLSTNHTQQFTIASIDEEILLKYNDGITTASEVFPIAGSSQIVWDLTEYAVLTNGRTLSGGCIDRLYAVNGQAGFFEIDLTEGNYERTDLPTLPGGSIANALDQENGIVYINVNKTLYAYDVEEESFSTKFTSNPFNGSYPRFEYRNDTFYMGNNGTMYTVNAQTNEVIQRYDISGFVNSNSGGDLAFASDGTLYLACFSGLYKFTALDDENGIATIVRISAENFPYQLTSMAIDRQDRIFVGTNDDNSRLIEISKEDGAYQVVRTYDRKINDLTAWKCETSDLGQQDSDGDGVIDILDDHPDDPDAAFDIYTPSEIGYGTLAFEDMWPAQGDFDFNDLVVNYRIINVMNTSNQSVRLKMDLKVAAAGATFKNGFGIELPIDGNLISSVEGDQRSENIITVNGQGLEEGHSNAVIIPFDNAQSLFGGNSIVNTRPNHVQYDPVSVNIIVHFTAPIDASLLNNAPYNPFMFIQGDRGREVHLKNYNPTSLADHSHFQTEDDITDIGIANTYINDENIPWAINMIHNFRFPTESTRIDKAYNYFNSWGKSNGVSYQDWYTDANGYRNTNKIMFIN